MKAQNSSLIRDENTAVQPLTLLIVPLIYEKKQEWLYLPLEQELIVSKAQKMGSKMELQQSLLLTFSLFFGFFFQQNQQNEELELLVRHKK